MEAAYDRRFADEMAMEDMTEEEIEAYKEQVQTTLNARRADDKQDLDSILSEKANSSHLAKTPANSVLRMRTSESNC